MKKLLVVILILIIVTGCHSKTTNRVTNNKKEKDVVEKDDYVDDNIMPISFYKDNGSKLIKLDAYQQSFNNGEDIGIFQVFPSNDKEISYDSFPMDFNNKWREIDKKGDYRIGFNLKYSLNSGRTISHNILYPKDTMRDDYYNYIIPYLYDDYAHINDSWYSHIENDEYNDDTYYTSIKLYANGMAHEIDSKIVLTVFTYNGQDDFNDNNEYRGNSSASINICDPNRKC